MEDGRLLCLLALQKISFQRVAYCGAPRGGADLVFRTIMCMDDPGQERNTPTPAVTAQDAQKQQLVNFFQATVHPPKDFS